MKQLLTWLDRLFYAQVALAAVIAFAMGILVFISAVMRYIAGAPLDFSDELVALMFVSASFLCLPYATRRGLNIRLDLLTRRLQGRTHRVLSVIAGLATVVILAAFSVAAVEEIIFAYEIEEVTNVAEVPVYPFKALVLFSAFSTVLAMLVVVLAGPLSHNGDEAMEGIE